MNKAAALLKQFAGGFLAFGAAGTPNTFQAIAVNRAFGDDIDRWAVMADEGDPADLLMNRVRTFHDGCAMFVSTPTLKGGRIDTLYGRSDQRRYFVTCPGCGHQDWIAERGRALPGGVRREGPIDGPDRVPVVRRPAARTGTARNGGGR